MANIYETLLNADITSATDTNNINTNNNVAKVYDGDTTYQNGVGYRALGIDTPEMNTNTKVDTLTAAREQKLDRLKPTAGELAKLEAELNPLNYLPSGTNAGTDKYGRVLNQNEAYKNDMIHRGYAVPTFFSDENDISSVESMNRAKEAKRGLWADPEYAKEMAGIVDKRIMNSTGASNEIKNAAGYATHQGNTTVDDYMDYAKVKDESNWIDALQAQASRVLSIPEYLVAQSERVFSPETAQDSIDRVAYQMENADILAGYNADEASLPNKLGRAAMSGSMHVANKVAGLAGEGIESLGGAFHGIKNLNKENARLAKYGEEVSDTRANILDTLQVGEAGDWLKELGKGIQKDTVEFTKKNNSSKLAGFNTKDVNELQTEVMDTIDKEGYMAAFGKAVTDERSLQVLAQSVPEMIALAFSVGGMALVNVNNNINIAEDNAGRGLTPNEKVLSAITSVVGTYLDRLGDKLALSGMNPAKEALKVAIDGAPAVVKRELGKEYGQAILKIGEAPLRLAGAAAVEGATEYAQTLGEEAAQNVGVFKNGFTDEQLREAQGAGVLGAAMGAQIATPSVGKDVLSSGGTLVAESVEKSREALQTKKEDIKVAPTTADKVNIAKAFASGNDTTGILGSDRTALEKAIAVRDMVSTLVETGALTDENTAVIANKVAEAMPEADVANLIATGKDLGELKKSALAVSKEVSEGPKGFLTYYNKAVEAKDPKDIEANVTKLEGFMQKQQEKLIAFYSEEAKVLSEYQSEAEIKGITLEELYDRVKNKNTKSHYTYGDNGKAWLKKEAVLEKHLSGDGEFNGSSYIYINMLNKEVESMNRLHSSLVNDVAPMVIQEPAVVAEPEVMAPVETAVEDTSSTTNKAVKLDNNKIKLSNAKDKDGIWVTSNIPIITYNTNTKNVSKDNRAVVNTVISSVSRLAGVTWNNESAMDKLSYVKNNSYDKKLQSLLDTVLGIDKELSDKIDSFDLSKRGNSTYSIDSLNDLVSDMADSYERLHNAKEAVFNHLSSEYGVSVTANHKESENVNTGSTTKLFFEQFVPNYMLSSDAGLEETPAVINKPEPEVIASVNTHAVEESTSDENSKFVVSDSITSLKGNQIFVFGANAQGVHGKGSALQARKFGTPNGEAVNSLSGNGKTWGIVTKESPYGSKVSKETLIVNIKKLLKYASIPENANKEFLFTAVGTGLAGFTAEDILEAIGDVNKYNNIKFPAQWKTLYENKEEGVDQVFSKGSSNTEKVAEDKAVESKAEDKTPKTDESNQKIVEAKTKPEPEAKTEETPAVELSPNVTAVLDSRMARGDAVEDIVDSINATKATELQKAMAVNYVKESVTAPKKTENKVEEPKSLMDALIDLKDDAPNRVNSVREALQLDTERTTLAQQIRVANAAGDKEQVKQLNVRMNEINEALDKVGNKVIAEFGQKKVRGAGLSNRFATSVFEPKSLTGLSIAGEIDATREVAKVKKVLKPKDAKGVTDAPATSFIYDENGEVNPRVAIALAATASNYIVELEETLMRMDMEEFQSRFTASDVNDINIVTEWRDMATPLRFEAEKIGAEVLNSLGLAVNKTTSLTYEQGLKADLGSVVLAMLRDSGAVKIGKIGNIHAVSVGHRIDTEISKITAKGYEDKYGVSMYKGRTYSTTAPVGEREVGVHRQELMEATPEQAEIIRKQEAMSYSVNGGMSVLKEVFGTKEELKKALGKGTRYKSKYMKDAQKSKDREIDISVDSLYELDEVKDVNGNSANVWFKWFLSKNGRFGLDSTTVNPQSDKLHRFLVTAESAKSTISEEDIADINAEVSSNDKSIGFKYAVVQAFDGIDGIPAIDKSSRKKVEEAANEILKMSDEELLGLVKTLGDKKKGHIGHAAAAVDAVRKLKVGATFVSTLTVEFDGLTNGFAFKMLQSPLGDFYRWLARVGVIGKGHKAYGDVKSIAELKANGMLDTYEVLGSLVKFPDAVETPKVAELVKVGGLPDVTYKKSIRNLMKSPVMVFNYGAGLPSIKKAITKELLIDAIEAIATNPKLKSKYGLKDVDLAKTPITDASLVPLVRVLSTEIETAYATPIAEALKKEFKDTIEYNTTINNVFGILYNDFVNRYSAKVKGLNRGVTMPSKEENLNITQDILKEYGPVIDGPTTQGLLDRILISQRGATDVESLLGNSAITTVPSAADFGGELSTVSIVVRGIGDPGASGGVIPTHTADGAVQGKTMKDSDGGYLGVHDAMVLGLDQLSSAKDYNRHWYEVNKDYSIVSSIVKATETVVGLTGKEQSMVAKLKAFEDTIQANRAVLFGSDMKVGQMVGLPGSMYEVNVKKEPGIIVPKFKTLKDMKDRTNDVRLKNILTDMLKKKKSVIDAINMIDTKVYEGRQLDWLGNADIVQIANEFREVESDGNRAQDNVRTDIMKDTTLNSRATGVLIKDVKDCRI